MMSIAFFTAMPSGEAMCTVPSSSTSIGDAGLLDDAADGLAARADDVADLVGLDLQRGDARRVLRQLVARRRQRLGHLAEDVQAAFARLVERRLEDLARQALDLDVHLDGGDAVFGAADLEVHVAEVILVAEDVGEDGDALALLDEAHGDAGDRRLDRHARVHQRQRCRRTPTPSTS